MTTFDNVLQQLRTEHKQAQAAVEKLQQAISTIEALNGNSTGARVNGTRRKRTFSAAARRRIAAAQRARWAKVRRQLPQSNAKRASSRKISAEGRRRIAAAARARWARVKAQQARRAA